MGTPKTFRRLRAPVTQIVPHSPGTETVSVALVSQYQLLQLAALACRLSAMIAHCAAARPSAVLVNRKRQLPRPPRAAIFPEDWSDPESALEDIEWVPPAKPDWALPAKPGNLYIPPRRSPVTGLSLIHI